MAHDYELFDQENISYMFTDYSDGILTFEVSYNFQEDDEASVYYTAYYSLTEHEVYENMICGSDCEGDMELEEFGDIIDEMRSYLVSKDFLGQVCVSAHDFLSDAVEGHKEAMDWIQVESAPFELIVKK